MPELLHIQSLTSSCRVRVLGSAVLNACMVASGSVDGFYQHGLCCWDIAAVAVIVKEAGGVVMSPTGEHGQSGPWRDKSMLL